MALDFSSLTGLPTQPRVAPPESGDTVRVTFRVQERGQERTQAFEGVVLRVRPTGPQASFTVRRIAAGNVGVERTFFLHSPLLDRVEILRRARVRRSRLYYLRELRGRKARLKERARPPRAAQAATDTKPATS